VHRDGWRGEWGGTQGMAVRCRAEADVAQR
jgi:hypothetical protein